MLGLVGLTTYSVPAFLGLRILFVYEGYSQKFLTSVSFETILVYWCAWIVILLINSAPIFKDPTGIGQLSPRESIVELRVFFKINLSLFVLGFLYLSIDVGPLFFLHPRDDQQLGLIPLLWKWTVPFMVITSVLLTRRSYILISIFCLAIIFLRGDRTILVISGMIGIFLTLNPTNTLVAVVRLRHMIVMCALSFLILYGKPIYVISKSGNFLDLVNLFDIYTLKNALWNFEPMGTITHLETSIAEGFRIGIGDFFISVFGNLLILPSAFGVETNLYNLEFTKSLPYELSFGIAGNFWAHAWSVGGIPMVVVFAFLYSFSLVQLQRVFFKSRGTGKVLAALAASIIAVYSHRNGLDNLMSFIRQIVVLYVFCFSVAMLLKKLPTKTSRQDISVSDSLAGLQPSPAKKS